jgi:[protein-PII] uridylyltransferase
LLQPKLEKRPYTLSEYRQFVTDSYQHLQKNFNLTTPITQFIQQWTHCMDQLLLHIWAHTLPPHDDHLCLIAVGGYGRAILFPYSDIDLLILHDAPPPKTVDKFIRTCWDIGLKIGSSVRTCDDCVEVASGDVTVMTNLLEMRLLTGNQDLWAQLNSALQHQQLWPSEQFFHAKLQEQQQRYSKFANTTKNLEPNIKTQPGGLRDIHTVVWVARKHLGISQLQDLVELQLLTQEEYQQLISARAFLWQIRFSLHLLTHRDEDRLLFDHQYALAQQFVTQPLAKKQLIECFMQRYYLAAKTIRELNELLLQLFREEIIQPKDVCTFTQINPHYRIANQYIEVTDPLLFQRNPNTLFDIFIFLAEDPSIKGVRAATIRLLRTSQTLIDNNFRQDKENQQKFMRILHGKKVAAQLRRMNHYRLLPNYLPAFKYTVGKCNMIYFMLTP